MSFFVGIDLGLFPEPSAIVVVEAILALREPDYQRGEFAVMQRAWAYVTPGGTRWKDPPPATYAVRHVERLGPGISYPEIVERVRELYGQLNKPIVTIDVTAVGHSTIELFEDAGLHPDAIVVTRGDATTPEGGFPRVPINDLISSVQVLLQKDRLKIAQDLPHADTLFRELQRFRMDTPLRSDPNAISAWREGPHNDLLLALAIAVWSALDYTPNPPQALPTTRRDLLRTEYWKRWRRRHG